MAIVCPMCKRQYDVTLFEFGRPVKCDCGHVIDLKKSAPIEVPIGDELDLHTFNPAEVKELVSGYIKACSQRGISSVRIIHGKGTGSLQRSVHSILRKLPEVESLHLAGHSEGGWGATIVTLKNAKT